MLARQDLLVRDVETVVDSMTEGLEPAAPARDTELVRVDPHEPAVRASLEAALRRLYTSGDPLAGQYVDIILEAYERMTQIDLGYSPRRTDADRIRNTDRMRATFVAALDTGALNPRAADIFLEHLSQARRGPGGDAAAFARGDLIWIDRASGATVGGPVQGAVPWPATNGGAWWVDHIVELQHGGADAPSNYLPLPDRLNFLKSGAMTRFTNGFRESQLAARAGGEDVSASAPDPRSEERRRRAVTSGRR